MENVRLCDSRKKRAPLSPTKTMYFLVFIVKISAITFGFETGAMSTTILLIQNIVSMRITPLWRQLILAGSLPSAAIFSVIGGWLCDRFGRKKCVMFSCFCFVLGSIITAAANNREVLLVGRLIIGAGIGVSASNPSVYVAECSPSHMRGCLVAIGLPLTIIGIIITDVISVAFSYDTINGWRYIWGFLGLVNFLQLIGCLFLPESPSWLLRESREKEAKESLMQLRKDKNVDRELWEMESNHKQVMESIEKSGGGNLFLRMLKTGSVRRALIVGCGLQIFAEFAGVHTLIYYSSSIIQMSGIGDVSSAMLDTGIVNCITLTFSIVGVWLIDRVGRRALSIIGMFGLFASSLCLGTTFLFATMYSPWVNASSISLNGPCSTYSQCNDCIRNAACGFCYEDKPYVKNGACLLVSDASRLRSELGACNSSLALQQNSRKWAYNYCPISFSLVALVGLALYLVFYAIGMGQLPLTINSEIYPLWARCTGNGIASLIFFISLLINSVSFLSFVEIIHDYGAFYLMAVVALVGAIFFIFFLPETKNKSLEEIEELFKTK